MNRDKVEELHGKMKAATVYLDECFDMIQDAMEPSDPNEKDKRTATVKQADLDKLDGLLWYLKDEGGKNGATVLRSSIRRTVDTCISLMNIMGGDCTKRRQHEETR